MGLPGDYGINQDRLIKEKNRNYLKLVFYYLLSGVVFAV